MYLKLTTNKLPLWLWLCLAFWCLASPIFAQSMADSSMVADSVAVAKNLNQSAQPDNIKPGVALVAIGALTLIVLLLFNVRSRS